MAPVVQSIIEAWSRGEKVLVFCFRVNTARRLKEIVDDKIRDELEHRRTSCLGGENSLRALRGRMTRREGDLVVLGLDRVLWSLYLVHEGTDSPAPYGQEDMQLRDEELGILARLGHVYEVDLLADKVDRVFVHRATEYILARRFLAETEQLGLWRTLLEALAEDRWIQAPYGIGTRTDDDEIVGNESSFEEKGVHAVYRDARDESKLDQRLLKATAEDLVRRRVRAREQGQISVFDTYSTGMSLWEGSATSDVANRAVVGKLHRHLLDLTGDWGEEGRLSRLLVMQAMRRVLLRESVLVRLLPARTELDESGWGELLMEAFYRPFPGQRESMADRVEVFLEDLVSASGSVQESGTARFALLDASRLRDQGFVALVDGSTKKETKERVFAGFNTPLLPEILVCTSVGQEGIDLHRHCRNVIHYDLAWNPAVIEQRTGRVDRIGSKTFRERRVAGESGDSFLEIGVPFLAGTYDERMFAEVRLRAQTFEVLTGGDMTFSKLEGSDEIQQAEDTELGLSFIPLPEGMVGDLRVNLSVWRDT
ncbi:MAG: SWF/SNF helicase family protein [bacterium]|nr:SWF/SNF helicase family protein [bacterium]